MSLLYHSNLPKSRGSNRNNYMGSSVNRRNDTNLLTQNYNNYYGAPSVTKDPKPSTLNQGSNMGYLASVAKNSEILPKINSNSNKKDDDLKRNLHSR